MGGGNPSTNSSSVSATGLSPRGRGKRPGRGKGGQLGRSIPAWAGETPAYVERPTPPEVYPRVGGGNWSALGKVIGLPGLSPRGRGKPHWLFATSAFSKNRGLSPRGRGKQSRKPTPSPSRRSIPAWAGETSALQRRAAGFPVYPRVGGGNRQGPPIFRGFQGSIPAWAGETKPRTAI